MKSKTTILLINENEEKRSTFGHILREAGYVVKEASIQDEPKKLARVQPNLIVLETDIHNPSGFNFCRSVKASPSTATIPILYLSKNSTEDASRVQKAQSEVDGFLVHPFEPEVLLAYVKVLLKRPQSKTNLPDAACDWDNTFDSISDCICLLNLNGKILRCNKAMRNYLNVPLNDILGKVCWELLYKNFNHLANENLNKMRTSRSRQLIELKIDNAWYQIVLDPLIDKTDKLLGAVHIMTEITERKQLEAKLLESEEKYRNLFETVSKPIMVIDPETNKFLDVNEAAFRVYGYSKKEFLKLKHTDITAEPERSAASFRKVVSGKLKFIPLRYHKRKNGEIFPVEISFSRFTLENRPVVCGVIKDISEHRKAELQLAESYHIQNVLNSLLRISMDDISLELILENALDVIVSIPFMKLDPKCCIFLVEDEPEVLICKTNHRMPEILQKQCAVLPFGFCHCGQAAASGQILFANCVDNLHDIRYKGIESHGHYVVPILSKNEVLGVIMFYLEAGHRRNEREVEFLRAVANTLAGIIERKRGEDALRQAENKYRSIFENAIEGIYQSTPEGRIITVNPKLAQIFGYQSPEEMMREVIDIERQFYVDPARRKEFIKLLETQGSVVDFESQMYHRDGRVLWISENAHIVRSKDNEILFYEGSMEDITEQKRAEKEKIQLETRLLQKQKMEAIGTLAGGIAHDFNNILWVIMGNTEMSLRKLPKTSSVRSKLQEILIASKRGQELVEQILTFSRQEQQEHKPIHIHLILKEVVKMLRATLPSTIKIQQKIEQNCGRIVADPTQVHQLIMNLCTNACQAMSKNGGIIKLKLRVLENNSALIKSYPQIQDSRYIELTISDTGCGMDKATKARIFDPFFTTKEVGEGTGLGLSTVHWIVTGLGGLIDVDSEPGKGSTFRVLLPRIDDVFSEETKNPIVESDSNGNEHVMIVDDEMHVVTTLANILEYLGYQVTPQSCSLKAFKLFSEQPGNYDLIITDQVMPDLTGLELAKKITHIRPDIPVILTTGYGDTLNNEKINQTCVKKYLKKPIVIHELEKIVRQVLDEQTN